MLLFDVLLSFLKGFSANKVPACDSRDKQDLRFVRMGYFAAINPFVYNRISFYGIEQAFIEPAFNTSFCRMGHFTTAGQNALFAYYNFLSLMSWNQLRTHSSQCLDQSPGRFHLSEYDMSPNLFWHGLC